jgi:large subunit ribosomal protein L15
MMRLNELSPAPGSKPPKKRVGRGTGSGLGKTCGRGHRVRRRARRQREAGLRGRSDAAAARVPKFGFRTQIAMVTAEVRLGELAKIGADIIDLRALKAANLVTKVPSVRG